MNSRDDTAADWIDFWNQQHSIYVNRTHFDVHYRDIARGIVSLLPAPDLRVLDFGCGEALHSDIVADAAAKLWLYETAASVRANLARRFAGNERIEIIGPEQYDRLPAKSLDVIVANSVLQYIAPDELDKLLARWRDLLTTDGLLIVGDVIPPGISALSDVAALLRYAAQNGFLLAALIGLVRTALSPYRRIRSRLGMSTYTMDEFIAKLAAAGFTAKRNDFNLEHHPRRMTFLARPVSDRMD